MENYTKNISYNFCITIEYLAINYSFLHPVLKVSAISGGMTALILLILVTPAQKCSLQPLIIVWATSLSSSMVCESLGDINQNPTNPSVKPSCSASLKFMT